jgi:hypothetical protein
MTRRLLIGFAALALVCGLGCKKDGEGKYKELNLEQAVAAHKGGTAVFFDVNGDDFRKEHGKVPGAILLSSSSQYELSSLPAEKDKELIFYCTSKT